MLRKLLAAGAIGLVAYVLGTLFGYRAAVVDYVENDAATIRSMADTMYDTVEKGDLPEEVQEAMEEAEGNTADSDGNGRRGFQ